MPMDLDLDDPLDGCQFFEFIHDSVLSPCRLAERARLIFEKKLGNAFENVSLAKLGIYSAVESGGVHTTSISQNSG